MTIVRASLTAKCDGAGCGIEKTFSAEGPEEIAAVTAGTDTDGWLFSEIRDLCPVCWPKQDDVERKQREAEMRSG